VISSEQAFDMLPYVAEMYEKLDIESYRKKSIAKNKGKNDVDLEKVGLDVLLYVVKNLGKVKEEFFAVAAIADNKPVAEIKAQSITKTISTFKDVFTDKELMSFFKTAM
jgi:hypothetical protein